MDNNFPGHIGSHRWHHHPRSSRHWATHTAQEAAGSPGSSGLGADVWDSPRPSNADAFVGPGRLSEEDAALFHQALREFGCQGSGPGHRLDPLASNQPGRPHDAFIGNVAKAHPSALPVCLEALESMRASTDHIQRLVRKGYPPGTQPAKEIAGKLQIASRLLHALEADPAAANPQFRQLQPQARDVRRKLSVILLDAACQQALQSGDPAWADAAAPLMVLQKSSRWAQEKQGDAASVRRLADDLVALYHEPAFDGLPLKLDQMTGAEVEPGLVPPTVELLDETADRLGNLITPMGAGPLREQYSRLQSTLCTLRQAWRRAPEMPQPWPEPADTFTAREAAEPLVRRQTRPHGQAQNQAARHGACARELTAFARQLIGPTGLRHPGLADAAIKGLQALRDAHGADDAALLANYLGIVTAFMCQPTLEERQRLASLVLNQDTLPGLAETGVVLPVLWQMPAPISAFASMMRDLAPDERNRLAQVCAWAFSGQAAQDAGNGWFVEPGPYAAEVAAAANKIDDSGNPLRAWARPTSHEARKRTAPDALQQALVRFMVDGSQAERAVALEHLLGLVHGLPQLDDEGRRLDLLRQLDQSNALAALGRLDRRRLLNALLAQAASSPEANGRKASALIASLVSRHAAPEHGDDTPDPALVGHLLAAMPCLPGLVQPLLAGALALQPEPPPGQPGAEMLQDMLTALPTLSDQRPLLGGKEGAQTMVARLVARSLHDTRRWTHDPSRWPALRQCLEQRLLADKAADNRFKADSILALARQWPRVPDDTDPLARRDALLHAALGSSGRTRMAVAQDLATLCHAPPDRIHPSSLLAAARLLYILHSAQPGADRAAQDAVDPVIGAITHALQKAAAAPPGPQAQEPGSLRPEIALAMWDDIDTAERALHGRDLLPPDGRRALATCAVAGFRTTPPDRMPRMMSVVAGNFHLLAPQARAQIARAARERIDSNLDEHEAEIAMLANSLGRFGGDDPAALLDLVDHLWDSAREQIAAGSALADFADNYFAAGPGGRVAILGFMDRRHGAQRASAACTLLREVLADRESLAGQPQGSRQDAEDCLARGLDSLRDPGQFASVVFEALSQAATLPLSTLQLFLDREDRIGTDARHRLRKAAANAGRMEAFP